MTLWQTLSIIALSLGALYGLACLVAPDFAAKSVRLQADPDRPGGFAEFRATLGGVFLFLHLAAIVFALAGPGSAQALASATVIAAGWFGAAVGRSMAIALDRDRDVNPAFNAKLVGLELLVALAIAAPTLQG